MANQTSSIRTGAASSRAPSSPAVKAEGIQISMDGRGRALDNIFAERLWRSVKYEDIYLHDHSTVAAVIAGLKAYFESYNVKRQHQSLDYQTRRKFTKGRQPEVSEPMRAMIARLNANACVQKVRERTEKRSGMITEAILSIATVSSAGGPG